MNNSVGAIGPRTSNWGMTDIRFYSFAPYMTTF